MLTNFLYVTFAGNNWQKQWVIISDSKGLPITDIKAAKKHLHEQHPGEYWGIADHEQMLMNNAMQDNF